MMAIAADLCVKDDDEVEPVVCPVLAAVPALRSLVADLVRESLELHGRVDRLELQVHVSRQARLESRRQARSLPRAVLLTRSRPE
jgi:hypothetical protein